MSARETADNDAPRCGCCDSLLVNGACPTRWIDNDGEECRACVLPPEAGKP